MKISRALFCFLLLGGMALSTASARADLGPLEPIADAHRALHSTLGLPEPMIVRLLERGLPEPDLPAVGLIAQQAHVPAIRVADLRLHGMSYNDIALHFGTGPEIFYVPFAVDPGPPYGKAWGYYKKTPRARWRTIRLSDADIVNYSNVLVVNRYYAVPPARVVEMRRGGRSFNSIHQELYSAAHPGARSKSMKDVSKPGKGHGAQPVKTSKAHHGASKKPPKGHPHP